MCQRFLEQSKPVGLHSISANALTLVFLVAGSYGTGSAVNADHCGRGTNHGNGCHQAQKPEAAKLFSGLALAQHAAAGADPDTTCTLLGSLALSQCLSSATKHRTPACDADSSGHVADVSKPSEELS